MIAAIALMLAIIMAGAVDAQTRMVLGHDTVLVTPRSLEGQLTPPQLRAVAPHVAALAVTPQVVRLRVGDTLVFDSLAVAVLDSGGHVLGRLRGFDLHLRRGLLQPLYRSSQLVAKVPGAAHLEMRFPRAYWGARTDPPPIADVRIEIAAGNDAPQQRDVFCPLDVDSAVSIVSHDYAGFAEVRDRHGAELAPLIESVRSDGRDATNAAACTETIARFLDFFHDRRLTITSRDAVGSSGAQSVFANRPPSIRYLDSSTALLVLPDFRPQFAKAIDSLVAAERDRLSRTPYLIIDLRGNGGGAAPAYAPVQPLFATTGALIHESGTEILASAGNARATRERLAEVTTNDSAADHMRVILGQMQSHPGQFVLLTPDHDLRIDAVGAMPNRVAVLVDRACMGACEELVLEARQSAKVILIGENTGGLLDYGAARPAPLPAGERTLLVPMARSRRLPAQHLDWVGIPPTIRINPASAIVEFARRELESPGQPRPGPREPER